MFVKQKYIPQYPAPPVYCWKTYFPLDEFMRLIIFFFQKNQEIRGKVFFCSKVYWQKIVHKCFLDLKERIDTGKCTLHMRNRALHQFFFGKPSDKGAAILYHWEKGVIKVASFCQYFHSSWALYFNNIIHCNINKNPTDGFFP